MSTTKDRKYFVAYFEELRFGHIYWFDDLDKALDLLSDFQTAFPNEKHVLGQILKE